MAGCWWEHTVRHFYEFDLDWNRFLKKAFLTSFAPLAPHFPSRVRADRFLIPPVHFLKDSAQCKRPARAWSPPLGVARTAILTGEGGERLRPLASAPEKYFFLRIFPYISDNLAICNQRAVVRSYCQPCANTKALTGLSGFFKCHIKTQLPSM